MSRPNERAPRSGARRAARKPTAVKRAPLAVAKPVAASRSTAIERAQTDAFDHDVDHDVITDGPIAADAGEPHLVRLNKYLADHGVASRRKCDELIAAGQVTVDGEATHALGLRIDPARQTVETSGFVLRPEGTRRRYYLLNKPAGVVCTNEEREVRPRAVDLITDRRKGRIYTVGRLDEESKGLILLTNDGEFANRIMHPRFGVEKTYLVRVNGKIEDEALHKIREGVHLSEGKTAGARVLVEKRMRDHSTLSLTLREGMNREIRRVFARVGYKVVELRRTRIGPLTERGLKVGRWRELTRREVDDLVAGRNESEPLDSRAPKTRKPTIHSGRRAMKPRGRAEGLPSNRRGPPARRAPTRARTLGKTSVIRPKARPFGTPANSKPFRGGPKQGRSGARSAHAGGPPRKHFTSSAPIERRNRAPKGRQQR